MLLGTGVAIIIVWNIKYLEIDTNQDSQSIIGVVEILRDAVLLLGNPLLQLHAQLDGHQQYKYYQDISLLTQRLQQTHQEITGLSGVMEQSIFAADARARRSFWLECTAIFLYYSVVILPLIILLFDLNQWQAMLLVIIVLSVIEYGYVQSWSKLSASMLHHRARSTCALMRLALRRRSPGSLAGTIKVLSLLSDVCRIKRQFEMAFAGTLMIVYEMLMYTSLFYVFFTMQMIQRSEMAPNVLLDFLCFQLPQILFGCWMVWASMQQFGEMVSGYYVVT